MKQVRIEPGKRRVIGQASGQAKRFPDGVNAHKAPALEFNRKDEPQHIYLSNNARLPSNRFPDEINVQKAIGIVESIV